MHQTDDKNDSKDIYIVVQMYFLFPINCLTVSRNGF